MVNDIKIDWDKIRDTIDANPQCQANSAQCKHFPSQHTSDEYTSEILRSLPSSRRLGHNFCKTCTLFIIPKLIDHRVSHDDGVELLAAPFHDSYLLSKFFYHHTQLWKWTVYDIEASIFEHLEQKSVQTLQAVTHWLLSLLRHFPLFRRSHYRFLLQTDIIHTLCSLIYDDKGFVSKHSSTSTEPYLYAALILAKITNWFFTEEDGVMSLDGPMSNIQRLTLKLKWDCCSNANSIAISDLLERYWKTTRKINQIICSSKRNRKQRERCRYEKCSKLRSHSEKWKVCSSCMVTGYCSRRCAKLDWNEGHHKLYCNQYAEMRKMETDPWRMDSHNDYSIMLQ